MPNRIIREGMLSSERIAGLGWPEEVFYRRLMHIVDDYGRTEANPQYLRSRCYPLQTDTVRIADITRWTAACQKAGLILDYEVDGKRYIELLRFGQKTRTPSKCPPPPIIASKCQQMSANAGLDVCVSVVVDGNTSADADLLDGVSPQVAKDFRALRKAKKAALTQTAVDGITREAAKAGLSLDDALKICCERGWVGFNAEWVGGNKAQADKPGGGRREFK